MFDPREYLTTKAEKAGVRVSAEAFIVNQDGRNFLLVDGKNSAIVSISGLEEIQNSSDQMMKDLLDTRFDAALATLRNYPIPHSVQPTKNRPDIDISHGKGP